MVAGVTGEEEACVGDVLTCKMTVEFLNLEKGQKTGFVHSKEYPFLRRDNWFLIITDEQMLGLAAVEKIPLTDCIYEKEFKERIQRPGKISFTCVLVNDSYRGLDQVQKVEVTVLEEPTNRETFEYSKYDLKEIRALNPVQAAMIDQANEDTDSDEEGDDEAAELRKKLKSAGLKKATVAFEKDEVAQAVAAAEEEESSSGESGSSSGEESSSEEEEVVPFAQTAPNAVSLI